MGCAEALSLGAPSCPYKQKSHTCHDFHVFVMCTHKSKIYNPFTKQTFFVNCGHCPACMMEKANSRLRRIKNSLEDGMVSLFITLTYAPDFLPYIKPDEVYEGMPYLSIYRDFDMRKVRVDSDYNIAYEKTSRFSPLKTFDCLEERLFYEGDRLPLARGSSGKIGILYFKDLQDFCKRLERNLFRFYGISGSTYKCYKISEYGETYFRPHFHVLLHCPSSLLAQFFAAVRASWPYDNQNLERQIEIAKNPSTYLSRYLCRPVDFPKFFEHKSFAPKASFSKGFGLANKNFSLPAIMANVDRGSCGFDTFVKRDGIETPINLLYPKYLLNRYFLKFKGYSRLSPSELFLVVRFPRLIYTFGKRLGYTIDEKRNDYENTIRILRRRYDRFCQESGLSGRTCDLTKIFAYYYWKVWIVYMSNVYKRMFDDVRDIVDMLECYENIQEVRDSSSDQVALIKTDLLSEIKRFSHISDPNLFHRTVARTEQLTLDYFSHIKKRKVSNTAYQENGVWI